MNMIILISIKKNTQLCNLIDVLCIIIPTRNAALKNLTTGNILYIKKRTTLNNICSFIKKKDKTYNYNE